MSDLIKFLLGEGEYDGAWFGEIAKQEKGAYWWRKYLRKYTDDQATEIKQLKTQNMAMSEVVEAAIEVSEFVKFNDYPESYSAGFNEFTMLLNIQDTARRKLAAYKQTIEG